jgi:Spy/CpxP family protein refolding chaperone
MRRKIITSIITGVSLVLFFSLAEATARHFKAPQNQGRMYQAGFLGEAGLKDFEEILSLTPDQTEKIQEILKNHRAQFKPERGDMSRPERRKDHDEFRATLYEEIMPLLNEKQQKILEGLKSDFEAGKVPVTIIETRVNRMAEDLDLSEAQSEKLVKVFTEFGEKAIKIRNSENPERGEMREIFAEMHDRLETILTPDQMTKWRESREIRRPRGGRKGMGGNGEFLKERLNLTPEQEEKVQEIFADARKEMDISREQNREKITRQLKEVLTEEQMAEFESMHNDYPGKYRGKHAGSRDDF